MRVKETIESVKRIPDQIKSTMMIAAFALLVAIIAMAMSATAVRRAA
jgi:hypothetical protein